MAAATQISSTYRAPARLRSRELRLFPYLLLGITLAASVPCLLIGKSQFIHYDGYWHIFIASQNRWSLFLSEWRGDAHPILYYLVLRVCSALGHSNLVYRSAGIIPGVAAVYVLGRVAEKLFASASAALLAAAAYGFSLAMIDMSCDVRGYPMALLFVLLAFYFFVLFWKEPASGDSTWYALCWSVFTTLAICTEYYAVFFFAACAAIFVIRVVWMNTFRGHFFALLAGRVPVIISVFGLPVAACFWLYNVHLRYQPPTENNVAEFYWTRGSSLIGFLWRGLRSDLSFLSPVAIDSSAAFAVILLAAAALLLYFFRVRRPAKWDSNSALPVLILMWLLVELMILSVARRYPFGGFVRQQSLIFPFFVLTAFLILDGFIAILPSGWTLRLAVAAAALAIASSFVHGWRRFPRISKDLFTDKYNAFERALPPPEAVYVDQFSLIAYFIHTHAWKWSFERHFLEPDRIDEYETTSPSGRRVALLRNLDQWNFQLFDPGFYRTLAGALKNARLKSANVFFLNQLPTEVNAAEQSKQENEIRKLALNAGLTASPILYDDAQGYVTLTLE